MRRQHYGLAIALVFLGLTITAVRGDDYSVDAVHSSATFKIGHLGISWIHGRFNDLSGNFSVADKGGSFNFTVKADSIDTGVAKRDAHLKSPDFFNVKQFPTITFKSTSVKAGERGLAVTGDLTMHGVTKSISFTLKGGKTAQFPPGVNRTGYTTDLTLKRSDFGMDRLVGPVGDEVLISFSFEGVKK
jgi:polyisoprenoid-binding protein YceI